MSEPQLLNLCKIIYILLQINYISYLSTFCEKALEFFAMFLAKFANKILVFMKRRHESHQNSL